MHSQKVFACLFICLFSSFVFAAGGDMGGQSQDGSSEYPYLIQDFADFNEFASDPCYWDDCIRLETDVNLAGIIYTTAVVAPDINNVELYFQGTTFTGIFDGNNHTINNLTINTADANNHYLGLFGVIENYTTIVKNLGLENVNIRGGDNSQYLGGLCGKVSNCGSIDYGNIIDCYSNGTITAGNYSKYLGGLCGSNDGTIEDCYTNGTVIGGDNSQRLGGLCGGNMSGTINNCYSNSTVMGDLYIGGLCGNNIWMSTITHCYATGDVVGNQYLGGLCGKNSGSPIRIRDCYATGKVTGNDYLGGLCGYNDGFIEKCYCIGEVCSNQSPNYLGAFCGYHVNEYMSRITDCFWDLENAGDDWADANNFGALGKTTIEMQTKSTFTEAGWEFDNYLYKKSSWHMPENNYPVLCFQNENLTLVPNVYGMTLFEAQTTLVNCGFSLGQVYYVKSLTTPIDAVAGISASAGSYIDKSSELLDIYLSTGSIGNGTEWNPLEIACQADLEVINNAPYLHYIMTCDIYISYEEFYSATVISPDTSEDAGFQGTAFRGFFDGDGHIINNLLIDSYYPDNDFIGLFGKIDDAVIKNLGLKNVFIYGGYSGPEYIGGLCGASFYSNIDNCYVNGTIVGGGSSLYVGGVCGESNHSYINNCYATGKVIGLSYLGGLCGYNRGVNISNCYSTSKIMGDNHSEYLGGLCGWNNGDVNNCFWDVEASGVINGVGNVDPDPNGVIGKSKAEMQTISTFTGWDFVSESANGDEDTWRMCEDGVSYPKLWWEFGVGDFVCGDGVDVVDFTVLAESWGLIADDAGYNERCDLTGDGLIGFADLAVFCDNWLVGVE